jgi:hypothetical protein
VSSTNKTDRHDDLFLLLYGILTTFYFLVINKKHIESEITSNGIVPTTTNRNNDSNLQWIYHQHIEEKKTQTTEVERTIELLARGPEDHCTAG